MSKYGNKKKHLIKNPEERFAILEKAANFENISAFCLENNISRSTFYRWKNVFDNAGLIGLSSKPTIPKNQPTATFSGIREKVVAESIAYPEYGRTKLSRHLGQTLGIKISSVVVQKILSSKGLGSKNERLSYLQHNTFHIKGRKYRASFPGQIIITDIFSVRSKKLLVAVDAYSAYVFIGDLITEDISFSASSLMRDVILFFKKYSCKIDKVIANDFETFSKKDWASYKKYLILKDIKLEKVKEKMFFTSDDTEYFHNKLLVHFFEKTPQDSWNRDLPHWIKVYNEDMPNGFSENYLSPQKIIENYFAEK